MKFNLCFTYDVPKDTEQVEDKVLVTDQPRNTWEIEINSLDDILKLANIECAIEWGGVLVYKRGFGFEGDHEYTIEIYNGYRE